MPESASHKTAEIPLPRRVPKFDVRPARESDAPQIVRLLREGLSSKITACSIVGCSGYGALVRDSIARQDFGQTVWYVMTVEGTSVGGVAELRRSHDELLWSQAVIDEPLRGRGLWMSMLYHATRSAAAWDQATISLDVFDWDQRLRRCYLAFGFEDSFSRYWYRVPLPEPNGMPTGRWHTIQIEQADRIQAAYGFSEFSLATNAGVWKIGRLADQWFRVTDPAAVGDQELLRALHWLDPKRDILCFASPEDSTGSWPTGATRFACSYRMEAPLDLVLERMASCLAF